MDKKTTTKNDVWSGRFSEPVDELVQRYTASVTFDKRMAAFDIQGSLAHAEMLCAQKILTEQDLSDIQRGLAQILEEINDGSNSAEALKELNAGPDEILLTGRLSNNTIVHFPGKAEQVGTLVMVKLDECRGFYYLGRIVSGE